MKTVISTSDHKLDASDAYVSLNLLVYGALAIVAVVIGYQFSGIAGGLVMLLLYLITLPLWIGLLTPLVVLVSAVTDIFQSK